MAVTLKGNNGTYEGTSEDNKPLDVPVNTEFNELDTGKTYYFDGETWNEEPPCEGSGFTPTTEQLAAMNSGITAEDVAQISTNENNISRFHKAANTDIYFQETEPTGSILVGSYWINTTHIKKAEGTIQLYDMYAEASADDKMLKQSGEEENLVGFEITSYIPISPNTDYTWQFAAGTTLTFSAPSIAFYDENKNLISGVSHNNNVAYITATSPSNAAYIRCSVYKKYRSNAMLSQGNNVADYMPYIIWSDSGIYNNSLMGKVWYVLGDSATHGDFTGITQPNISSGLYAGELPVYPYYIGNRTGMIIHNTAVNGASIATITGDTRYQYSVDGVYDTIVGSDADYITIWLGANDMWNSVPIGTIDSSDATTFYGAWNKILAYYCENFPNAKLGIVVSFWLSSAYADAVKAVATKYGIPCLNLYDDDKIPVTIGSQRPDVDASIKDMRNNQWKVSSTNNHPSAAYHEIESYFIEEWLKTL